MGKVLPPPLPWSNRKVDRILTSASIVFVVTVTDDKPDLSTIGVFLASTEQAIQYHPGVWHHPMIALGKAATDFTCIVNESATMPELDCDEVEV